MGCVWGLGTFGLGEVSETWVCEQEPFEIVWLQDGKTTEGDECVAWMEFEADEEDEKVGGGWGVENTGNRKLDIFLDGHRGGGAVGKVLSSASGLGKN